MTCGQFDQLILKKVGDCSVAEMSACLKHVKQCKRCESKAVAIARNPSEMTAGEIDALIQTTISIVVKINNDPELRK